MYYILYMNVNNYVFIYMHTQIFTYENKINII